MFARFAHGCGIGNDVCFHLRRKFCKALNKGLVFVKQPSSGRGAPHHNLAHPAHASVFRYLGGNVFTMKGYNNGAKILCQFEVIAQGGAAFGISTTLRVIYKKGCKISTKGLNHACGGADDPRIAGRA